MIVFGYDFSHQKTIEGLSWLLSEGLRPELVVLAPYRKINVPRPAIPISTAGLVFPEPRAYCEAIGLKVIVLPHGDQQLVELFEGMKPELGVILGARILSEEVINTFAHGVLNIHPGLLPSNRGLDTVRHAIARRLPQAVSAHLISRDIDRGKLLETRLVPVFENDCVRTIDQRVTNSEYPLLVSWVTKLSLGYDTAGIIDLGEGQYNAPFSLEEEREIELATPKYASNYAVVVSEFKSRQPLNP